MMVLYRTSFLGSMFKIIPWIKRGSISVNKRLINYLNYRVRPGDLIQFSDALIETASLNYKKRRLHHNFVMAPPRFFYVNFSLFYIIMERLPREKDLVFPIKLDIYRATGYY